ncbi:MAG: hypothetical protein ABL958_05845, partial [Bdellovibrionia bacterium]
MSINRRQFVAGLGAGIAGGILPLDIITGSILRGLFSEAQATVRTRYYLGVLMYGAPARWLYDLPLNPNGVAGEFAPNAQIITQFTYSNGVPNGGNYVTAPIAGNGATYQMSSFWQNTVAAKSGIRAAAPLLNNTLILRGADYLQDGHLNCATKQMQPIPGGPSINGLVSDTQSLTFPPILLDKFYAYKSAKGINPIRTQSSTFQQTLQDPFKPTGLSLTNQNAAVEEAISTLKAFEEASVPGAKMLYRDRENVKKIIQKGFSGLDTVWPQLRAKYLDLITRSINAFDVPNVNNVPFAGDNNDPRFQLAAGGNFNRLGNANVMTMFATSHLNYLADQFASVEYLLANSLTNSISLHFPEVTLNNLQIENFRSLAGVVTAGPAMSFSMIDEHETGAFI